jgi:hypothetical protein
MSNDLTVKKSTEFGAWIPQLFFDIIARIIPGFFILLVLLLSIMDADQFMNYLRKVLFVDSTHTLSANLLVLTGIGISYIFAIILREICIITDPVYHRKKKSGKFDADSELDSKEIFFADKKIKTNEIALRYDFIKLRDTANGNRITKLKAELQMSGILIIGSALSSLINLIMCFFDGSITRIIILAGTLTTGLLFLRAKRHFNDRLKIVVYNCSELLGFKKYFYELSVGNNPPSSKQNEKGEI